MTYKEARDLHGELIIPSQGARIIGKDRSMINKLFDAEILEKVEVEETNNKGEPITKTYVILSELNRYIKIKENKNTQKSKITIKKKEKTIETENPENIITKRTIYPNGKITEHIQKI